MRIDAAMATRMSKVGLDLFVEEFSNSPSMLAYLEASFSDADGGEALAQLADCADDSAYGLRQWVEALMVLGQWLDVRGLALSLEDRVGYVCCAAEASSGAAAMTHLPAVVEEMLENYGCELAVKK